MLKEVKNYIEAMADRDRVANDYSSNIMDCIVREDRVRSKKKKAINALGKEALNRIMEAYERANNGK